MNQDANATGQAMAGAKRGFVAWWVDGLVSCFETSASRHPRWTTLLFKSAEGITIYRREKGEIARVQDVPQAQLDREGAAARISTPRKTRRRDVTVLRLSGDQVLQNAMRIPKDARDVIDPIIINKMESVVPWPSADLSYGYEITDEDDEADVLHVTAIATSRKRLEEAVSQAQSLGERPAHVDFAPNPEAPVGIRFVGTEQNGRRRAVRGVRFGLAVLVLVTVLATAAGLWRMVELRSELRDIQATLSEVRSKVADANRLHLENEALMAQRARLVDQRRSEPAVVVVLEALSKALPDHSYLKKLEVRGQEVKLSGISTDAAALITRL
ncbi:MAG: PilN domain-containing protein, partial [Methyloligellaceae bacterium]